MREVYNEELREVKNEILLMSSQAEKMLKDAVDALVNKDIDLAKSVIRRDDIVDLKEIQLQQIVSEVIARQQPVASDLRRLSSTYKIINNLERIADLAVNISKCAISLKDTDYFKELDVIPQMAEMVKEQLKICIQAYIDEDISKIEEIISYENEIDVLEKNLRRECIEAISENADLSEQGLNLSFVGSYLERVGDHATNIFETVYYIVTSHFIDFNDPNLENFAR